MQLFLTKFNEIESLQYDALEHLAGYICYKVKNPELIISHDVVNTTSDTFTWTNQIFEGFLEKPKENLMLHMEELEAIFQKYNFNKVNKCDELQYTKHY